VACEIDTNDAPMGEGGREMGEGGREVTPRVERGAIAVQRQDRSTKARCFEIQGGHGLGLDLEYDRNATKNA
jgi:hypothetical protein